MSDDESLRTPTPRKRFRPLPMVTTASLSKKKKSSSCRSVTTHHAATSLFNESSDEPASSCWSDSDHGKLVTTWAKETVSTYRRRPEPHRSEAIRRMSHNLKVRDGSTNGYATLYEWGSYLHQSQCADNLRLLVARRCAQENIRRRKYDKDIVPHYQVSNIYFYNMHSIALTLYLFMHT